MHNPSILQNSFLTMPTIDWALLGKAYEYYKKYYTYQETPFAVPETCTQLTKPHNDQSFILNDGLFYRQPHELVGSAEQGFIYLALQNKLVSNKLFSISPCFRSENYDATHLPWFMKLELFHLSNTEEDVFAMMEIVKDFLITNCPGNYEKIQTSEQSWDIILNNIEIGSYGIRKVENLEFIYGTGLALPRLSQALENR